MRKAIFVALLGLSVPAFADSYDVTFGWTDPTTYIVGKRAGPTIPYSP